ncbi:MAG: pseudouridine synthase, partial [Chitinophagales bacterium]
MKKDDAVRSEKNSGTQLNKLLSNAGIASRRKCAEIIREGKVKVNGKQITEPGFRVKENDAVTYNGKKIESTKKFYVLLNKPRDYITTTSDERGRKTVMELIENATRERLYPVGRLDRNTTG